MSKFFFELFIVFIGVYGAFELNSLQESNRADKIKIDYMKSFRSELAFVRSHIINLQDRTNKLLNEFKADLDSGKRPILKPLSAYLTSQLLITQAGLNEDIFLQLNPGLASSLSGGYDNIKAATKWIDSFNDICNRNLISTEPIDFYNRQGELKPEFNWYLEGLQITSNYLRQILSDIDEGAMPATEALIKSLE